MFGIPYENLELGSVPGYNVEIPLVLCELNQYLIHNKGYLEEGIFRKTGSQKLLDITKKKLDEGVSINDINDNIIVSQLIKLFYREFPGDFLTKNILTINNNDNDSVIINEFNKINEPYKTLFIYCLDICMDVLKYEDTNKMNIDALCICMSPNFIRNQDNNSNNVSTRLFKSYEVVFKKLLELRMNNKIYNNNSNNSDNINDDDDDVKFDEIKFDNDNNNDSNKTYIRKRRKSSLLVTSTSHEINYRPSLNTGIFGGYIYKTDDIGLVRSNAIHISNYFLYKTDDTNNHSKLGLTNNEKQLINDFDNLLNKKYGYNIPYSQLIRYIIGCKGRLNLCEKRFLNLKNIEKKYNLNSIKLYKVRDQLKDTKKYVLSGNDIMNRSTLLFNINQFIVAPTKNKNNNNNNDNNNSNTGTIDINAEIGILLKSLLIYIDSITCDINVCRNGLSVIFNLDGLIIRPSNFNLLKQTIQTLIECFQNAYPLRLKKFIIVNAPYLLAKLISFSKLFLKKKLSKRIIVCENSDQIFKIIDKKNVPKIIGGTYINKQFTNCWEFVCSKVIDNDIETQLTMTNINNDDDDDDDDIDDVDDIKYDDNTNNNNNDNSKLKQFFTKFKSKNNVKKDAKKPE